MVAWNQMIPISPFTRPFGTIPLNQSEGGNRMCTFLNHAVKARQPVILHLHGGSNVEDQAPSAPF
jgi:hypothetical protein